MTTHDTGESQPLSDSGIRFENRSGALVVVLGHPLSRSQYIWACMGCRQTEQSSADLYDQPPLVQVTTKANTHAWRCRALAPLDETEYATFEFDKRTYRVEGRS